MTEARHFTLKVQWCIKERLLQLLLLVFSWALCCGGQADIDIQKGSVVTLISDESAFKRALNAAGYRWHNSMRSILGSEQIVKECAPGGIFGLEEAMKGIGEKVWFYPVSVVVSVKKKARSMTEVKAYMDAYGKLQLAGHTFFKSKQPAVDNARSKPECRGGLSTNVSYGNSEKPIMLAQTVSAGEQLVFSCSETFARADFAGYFMIRCLGGGSLEIEYECGCAAGSLPRPTLDVPRDAPTAQMCQMTRGLNLPNECTHTESDEIWTSGTVKEGEFEDRLCAELIPGMLGAWSITCKDGELTADVGPCLGLGLHDTSTLSIHKEIQSLGGEDEFLATPAVLAARKAEEAKFGPQVSRLRDSRRLSESENRSSSRRLAMIDLCKDPPQDNWWPDICQTVQATPYSTVAGAYLPGGTQFQLHAPYGIYVSPVTDNILIADWKNHRIQEWPQGSIGTVQTVAGKSGQVGSATDLSLLFNPADIVVSQNTGSGPCGEMFIADESNNRVLRWPPYSRWGYVVAGGTNGELDHPTGIFVSEKLDVYIADRMHHRVVLYSKNPYKLDWEYNMTIAGLKDWAPGTTLMALDRPTDVALPWKLDEIVIADFGNDRLVKWRHGGTVGVYVGRCFAAFSVYINEDGVIFAACQTSHCIKKWELVKGVYVEGSPTGACSLFVQAPERASWIGGILTPNPAYPATVTRFFSPSGVFVDKYGNVYVSDTANARVIKRGRDPLTQWTVVNGANLAYEFEYTYIKMFPDLNCSRELFIKTNISADGLMQPPWTPTCSRLGRCPINEAWIGAQFLEATEIRCVILEVKFNDTSGRTFDAAVRYWTGSRFMSVYTFGKIPSEQKVVLKYPRFDVPDPRCVKGQRYCVITFTGDWQADGDRIMITDRECKDEAAVGLMGVPGVGMSDRATKGGTEYIVGDPDLDNHFKIDARGDSSYKLCWCDRRLYQCELPYDYELFVSYLILAGPFDDQLLHGWRGSSLNLTNLAGVGLLPGDRLTVVTGKCGIAAEEVLGIPRQEGYRVAFSLESTSGPDYWWGPEVVKTDPGRYNLCWCRDMQYPCTELLHYQAKAGEISINGPDKGQNFTCTKGDKCRFNVSGVNFEEGDAILILARCGQGPLLNGFPWYGIPKTVTKSITEGPYGDYSWGERGITPTVGLKYVCWCGKPFDCSTVERFTVEVGTITFAGPLEYPITCALGAECEAIITGVLLQSTRRAMVIEEGSPCGNSSYGPVPNFPGVTDGVSKDATNEGTKLSWGFVDQKMVRPKRYQACWCHRGNNCEGPEDYKVVLGELSVIGPYEWDELKNCGIHKDCKVEILGAGLSRLDSMILVSGDCGDGTLASGVNATRKAVKDAHSSSSTGLLHTWDFPKITFFGTYKVCWCSPVAPSTCDKLEDFRMTVGNVSISSPRQNQQIQCTSGAVCYVTLEGYGLLETDTISILTPGCGNEAETVLQKVPNQGRSVRTVVTDGGTKATFHLGIESEAEKAVVSSHGGVYSICWCPVYCNSDSDYQFLAGNLTLWGPFANNDYTCYNGKTCQATGITGIGLQNNDKVRASSTCTIKLKVGGLPNQGVSEEGTDGGRSFSWGNQRLKGVVGKYRLCWCSFPHNCEDSGNYTTDIGALVIGGPVQGQTQMCQAGYECSLEGIEGYGLRAGDIVILLFTCGRGNPIYRGFKEGDPWRNWPPFISTEPYNFDPVSSKASARYYGPRDKDGKSFIFDAETGKYRMCWCDAQSGSCQTIEDFQTDIGLFTAVGPDADQSFECVPGFACTLYETEGVDLFAGDEYAVRTDPLCRGSNMVVAGIPNRGRSEPATNGGRQVTWNKSFAATTVPMPNYTLCWCPVQVKCESPDEFRTIAGQLSIVGPRADHRFTCYLGKKCDIMPVRGNALKNQDLLVLVNGSCGPGASLARGFPHYGLSKPARDQGQHYELEELVVAETGTYRICWCAHSRTLDPPHPVPFTCLENSTSLDPKPNVSGFMIDLGELVMPEVPVIPGGIQRSITGNSYPMCISGRHCKIPQRFAESNFTGFAGSTARSLPDGSQIQLKRNTSELGKIAYDPGEDYRFVCRDKYSEVHEGKQGTGFPNDAVSKPSINQGTEFAWGQRNQSIWAEGGFYLMCWKPAEATHFLYLLGRLEVVGPSDESQVFTCTKSAICTLRRVKGVGLGVGDFYRVMKPCAGNFDKETAQKQQIDGLDVVRMQEDENSESIVRWTAPQFQGAPGDYSVCWCHRSIESRCSDAVNFRTTVGEIIINGPDAGQNKKCNRGQRCTVSGIKGVGLEVGDESGILVECGVGPNVSGVFPAIASAVKDDDGGSASSTSGNFQTYSFSWNYLNTTPGIYRTCWCQASECAEPGGSIFQEGRPENMNDFDVEMGVITIQGPDNDDYTNHPEAPIWSEDWPVQLSGVNLAATGYGQLRIMKHCPNNIELGEEIEGGIKRVAEKALKTEVTEMRFKFDKSLITSIVPAYWWDDGQNDPKNPARWRSHIYKLCWCTGSPTGPDCATDDKFRLTLGPISVLCGQGSEPNSDTKCNLCPLGKYKTTYINEPCKDCSNDNQLWSTETEGTVYQRECFCKPGLYYEPSLLSCEFCPVDHYCIGGNKTNRGVKTRCPRNSGAWPDVTEGTFPAQKATDCSCNAGSEALELPNPQICTVCKRNFFKAGRGNSTDCISCHLTYDRSVSLRPNGSTECTCESGLFMYPSLQTPQYCQDCPSGYWCAEGVRNKCPDGKFTVSGGSTSPDACMCGAGYYQNVQEQCMPCPEGRMYYKDAIGNTNCDKRCPENSQTTRGAKSPENCKCNPGYIQDLNITAKVYTCNEDLDNEGLKPRTFVVLTSVWTTAFFIFRPPEDCKGDCKVFFPVESFFVEEPCEPGDTVLVVQGNDEQNAEIQTMSDDAIKVKFEDGSSLDVAAKDVIKNGIACENIQDEKIRTLIGTDLGDVDGAKVNLALEILATDGKPKNPREPLVILDENYEPKDLPVEEVLTTTTTTAIRRRMEEFDLESSGPDAYWTLAQTNTSNSTWSLSKEMPKLPQSDLRPDDRFMTDQGFQQFDQSLDNGAMSEARLTSSSRHLNSDNETTQKRMVDLESRNGTVIVPVLVVIWRGSILETIDLEADIIADPDRTRMVTLLKGDQTLESKEGIHPFKYLSEIKFQHDRTVMDRWTEYCPPNTAVPVGATFTSKVDSCKCMAGFQPRITAVYTGNPEEPETMHPCNDFAVDTGKCIPCCALQSGGTYKDFVGDSQCTPCPSNEFLFFPDTEPKIQAVSSTQCICDKGEFRPGELEQCLPCPLGMWCNGSTIQINCPPNENTLEVGQDNESDCECDKGYFKPLPHENDEPCVGCDPGYYKDDVANGIGRCTQRCSVDYGRRSTSKVAATKKGDCVCSINSYMQDDFAKGPEAQTCAACPLEGVTCTGWKRNITKEDGTWEMKHAPPEANPNYFMLDVRYAKVQECYIQTADGPACMGRGKCAEGHEGLLCGNCMAGYTRPMFPNPCRSCDELAPSGVLVLQLIGDATVQALWALFLAVSALQKTETQKNVLTVLLRMFTHWSTQVGVLSSNFNLSKLSPLATTAEENEEAESASDSEDDSVEVATPENETLAAPEPKFQFPPFFTEVSAKLTIIADFVAGVGSTQEVIECMIDRRFTGADLTDKKVMEQLQRWKLVGPALWWFMYPVLLVVWTAFVAALITYCIVPVLSWFLQPRVNPKKARKKKRRRLAKLKMEQMKKKKEQMDEQERRDAKHGGHHGEDVEAGKHVMKEELDAFDDDSSSCSSSSSSGADTANIEVYLQHIPEFLVLCDEMVTSVVNPARFSYEYVARSHDADQDDESGRTKRIEYYIQLFRKKPVYNREFIVDIMPWIIIMLNNVWNVATTRMLQLIRCEEFHWGGRSDPHPRQKVVPGMHLMMRPDVVCFTFESAHAFMAMIAAAGLGIWSFGIIVVYYRAIASRDLQSRFVTRNFGYLLEGYEPQFWFWELTVKKVDLLVTAIITYTSMAREPRSKLLLFSVQSALFYAAQLSMGPYDNRQLRLLDRMENIGLLVRQLIFTGISFALLFGGGRILTVSLAFVLMVSTLYFIVSLVLHAADDFITTQVAISKEKMVLARIDAKRKALKKMKKMGKKIDPDNIPEGDSSNFVAEKKLEVLTNIQQFVFAGGGSEMGYRHIQLLRCMWDGPGTDANLYIPHVHEGFPFRTTYFRTVVLYLIKWFNGITVSHQQNAFAEHMGCFVGLLLSLAKFNQFPARFTDMVFFLARAVRKLKQDMEENPNTMRPADPEDPQSKAQPFRDRDWLKVGMLEELYSSLILEGEDKRELLERVRDNVVEVFTREHVPMQCAFDVLDKLTNDQLRRGSMNAVSLFSRVDFYLVLSASTESTTQVVQYTVEQHAEAKKARRKMYHFVQFALRTELEEDAELDIDWPYMHQVLESLPFVELKRLVKNPEGCIDVAKAHKYLTGEALEEVTNSSSAMTVEDLNSMLMFLQKLPYDQLHSIIEYTQMLLDFLSLPAKAAWRDKVVDRGRRMGKEPNYYRRARKQRLTMMQHEAEDAKLAEVHHEVEQDAAEELDVKFHQKYNALGRDAVKAPPLGIKKKQQETLTRHALMQLDKEEDASTLEARLGRVYRRAYGYAGDAIEEEAKKHDAGAPKEFLKDMRGYDNEDNMSVDSLDSLDSAFRWPGGESTDPERHADPLWLKIEGLRRKTGKNKVYVSQEPEELDVQGQMALMGAEVGSTSSAAMSLSEISGFSGGSVEVLMGKLQHLESKDAAKKQKHLGAVSNTPHRAHTYEHETNV